jgi:hypothetical protein
VIFGDVRTPLTDDVREFLFCLADEGLPLNGWGDLDAAGLQLMRERLPGGGALGDSPDGLVLARRRATLLHSLCDAGRLVEARSGALQLTPLGWEFLGLPEAAQLGFVFLRRRTVGRSTAPPDPSPSQPSPGRSEPISPGRQDLLVVPGW